MSDTPRPRVDVVIPVYNEVKVLEQSAMTTLALFDQNQQYDWRLVIADNGSNDGTPELARSLEARHPRVKALVLEVKGRGLALREAWLSSDADIVSYMDVDLSTDLNHLPELIAMVAEQGCDVAIGSRLAKGSKTDRQLKREITSRGYVALIRMTFPRLRITDAQCGFKALNRKAVQAIVPHIENRMWFFDTEMLILAHQAKLTICELPVRWVEDTDTKVKIVSTAIEDIRGLARMRFRRRR
ncbi:MAG: glycosyltransferase family 2 protein [Chloroflexi bacterium]|nr:glycosyltransferase family 2 protein [Dehalococcoidia bacterium]MCO5202220.1 glycosyltransferase family 2 protein [Chloroflexota bacterium]MCZ7578142.1 glycosyltransferase family 2 protein [Dehalococcoidia bacterium]NJD66787.1 glycosyltransferase family 2 protein [Chloroflexota bacterium]PWB41463.1 MAG: glycosyl transferase [Dehalococcoidia bacterium]